MAAKAGSDKTIDMVAKKGRASYVGERSRGNRDPGSLIIVLMFEAALETLKGA
jgi:dihydroxyacetone kinase-like protein